MLWHVGSYSGVLVFLALIVAISTFMGGWMLIRRARNARSRRRLRQESGWYAATVESILEGRFWGDLDQLRKRPGSMEWRAIGELLLEAAGSPVEDQRRRTVQVLERLGYIEHYIRQLRAASAWRRSQAVGRLLVMQSREAVAPLIGLLDDPDPAVRAFAFRALGRLDGQEAIDALVGHMDRVIRRSGGVPAAVLKESLVAKGGAGVPAILGRITDPNDQIRTVAAEILGEIQSEAALPHLILRLRDWSPNVRAKAAFALGQIGHPLAVSPLQEALADPFWFVRLQAARSLGRLRSRRAIQDLCGCLEDAHWQVREAAITALTQLGELGIRALNLHLVYSKDLYTCEQIAETLQQLGWIQRWIEDLASQDEDRVKQAKNILSAIVRRGVFKPMVSAVHDHPDEVVRMHLIEILGVCLDESTAKTLRWAWLYDSSHSVRRRAQELLVRWLGQKSAFNRGGFLADSFSVV